MKQTKTKVTPEAVIALHKQGLLPSEIAAKLGTTYFIVHRRLVGAGIVKKRAVKKVKAREKEKTVAVDKVAVDKVAEEAIEKDKFTTFTQGYERGFKDGVESSPDARFAFDNGVRHIVTLAEDFLVKELGLPGRDALVKSGKIPAWWIAVLVTNFEIDPRESVAFRDRTLKGG